MATPTLNFGAYTPTELAALLTAAKAEYLRALGGRIQQGSSAAQSYGLTTMTVADLVNLINGLTAELGLDTTNTRVSPNFNTHRGYCPDGTEFGVR